MLIALRVVLVLIALASAAATASGLAQEKPSIPGPICFTLAVGFLGVISAVPLARAEQPAEEEYPARRLREHR